MLLRSGSAVAPGAATPIETLRQVTDDEPVPVRRLQPVVPADLETICHKCLRKTVAGRYASADALADDLERFVRGHPVQARPAGIVERVWKWTRRKPASAALIVLSAALPFLAALGVMIHIGRLCAEVRRAESAAAEALRQQQRADRNYRSARDALSRMLDRVQGGEFAALPRLTELQAKRAEDALAFYDAATSNADEADPDAQLDVARACRRAGELEFLLGRVDAARNGKTLCGPSHATAADPEEKRGVSTTAIGRAAEKRKGIRSVSQTS